MITPFRRAGFAYKTRRLEPRGQRAAVRVLLIALSSKGSAGGEIVSGVMRTGFSFEPELRQLSRGGRPRPIEPKVFDLIAVLLEERHRVVSRDELNARVWKGDRVCAAALTQCVWCARQAFGDSARQPRFILTQHRSGYRFIGNVAEVRAARGGRLFLLAPAMDTVVSVNDAGQF
jgi:DNA-binding winged helix-turn-helix (wHTH) protein